LFSLTLLFVDDLTYFTSHQNQSFCFGFSHSSQDSPVFPTSDTVVYFRSFIDVSRAL